MKSFLLVARIEHHYTSAMAADNRSMAVTVLRFNLFFSYKKINPGDLINVKHLRNCNKKC